MPKIIPENCLWKNKDQSTDGQSGERWNFGCTTLLCLYFWEKIAFAIINTVGEAHRNSHSQYNSSLQQIILWTLSLISWFYNWPKFYQFKRLLLFKRVKILIRCFNYLIVFKLQLQIYIFLYISLQTDAVIKTKLPGFFPLSFFFSFI